MAGDRPHQWDLILPQAEFAYNSSQNRTTGKTPFEIVYGFPIPHILIRSSVPYCGHISAEANDIIEHIKCVQQEVLEKLQVANSKYKEDAYQHRKELSFSVGDLIMVYFRCERFPVGS